MSKRAATTELNHENWDKEEEAEEPGVFQKASAEVLETRVIKTAKRRVRMSDSTSDSKPSPFSGFTGFGNATSTTNIKSPFSFLSQPKDKTLDGGDKNEKNQENNISSATKETQSQFKPFSNSFLSTSLQKESTFSSSSTQNNTASQSTPFKPFEHIFSPSKPSNENDNNKEKKSKNLELLKDLNLSCSSWIAEHLQKNPYCILTPIFKDYEKHLAQLDLNTHSDKEDVDKVSEKTNSMTSSTTTFTTKIFSPKKEELAKSDPSPEKNKDAEKEKERTTEFKFETQPVTPFNFQFKPGNTTNTFGTISTPFSLNQIAAKPVTTENETKNDEDAEEPPKNEFVPVIEEDSIFDIKCKVFVKKEGNFVSRGVGTLFLKPVKDSTKTQLIVRAHTNLGNILLNTLLVSGMPIQKTGKNNAMIVCIPTPEAKPPPVPVLIRVKTSDECDRLIKKLEECRGS